MCFKLHIYRVGAGMEPKTKRTKVELVHNSNNFVTWYQGCGSGSAFIFSPGSESGSAFTVLCRSGFRRGKFEEKN